jgi:hypothetical protein
MSTENGEMPAAKLGVCFRPVEDLTQPQRYPLNVLVCEIPEDRLKLGSPFTFV